MRRKLSYLGVDEAVKKIVTTVNIKPEFEVVPIHKAYGRVLVEDVVSGVDVPPSDISHFDGYAIRAEDAVHASVASPVSLKVIGRIYPGERVEKGVNPGEAYYITTGSFLPESADAVIMVEATAIVEKDIIKICKTMKPGENVIPAGEDVKKDETVFKKGHVLRAQDIGFLAVLRSGKVKVFRKPVVAIISSGDELINPMEENDPDKIVNSHSLVVSKLIMEIGGIPLDLGIVSDNLIKIKEKIEGGLQKADMILTIGGCSVGKKDFVLRAINQIGKPGVIVHGIKRKPGRVSGVGVIKGKPIVMLPGLIQSTIVGFHVLALPLIRLASGLPATNLLQTRRAKIAKDVAFKKFIPFQQVTFVKINIEKDQVIAQPIIGESNLISIPVKASGFIVTPGHKPIIKKGEEVEVHLLPGLFSNHQ
jgi:molybdenum cofactor synthesis domain-containing protein